jgi:ketosteroid isomerase-like protein
MTSTETGTPTQLQREVQSFAAAWYQALDRHDEIDAVLPYLLDDGLKLVFPEGTSYGHEGFRAWYEAVTHRFFDEVHTLREASVVATDGERTEVKVVVNWRAKIWNAPGPRSEWLGFDAYQTWIVTSGLNGLQIKEYVVNELRAMPGSAAL